MMFRQKNSYMYISKVLERTPKKENHLKKILSNPKKL